MNTVLQFGVKISKLQMYIYISEGSKAEHGFEIRRGRWVSNFKGHLKSRQCHWILAEIEDEKPFQQLSLMQEYESYEEIIEPLRKFTVKNFLKELNRFNEISLQKILASLNTYVNCLSINQPPHFILPLLSNPNL